jgi:trans-AT polyketide synthase/acyltransferase/oxidoreductase domain-containing protein
MTQVTQISSATKKVSESPNVGPDSSLESSLGYWTGDLSAVFSEDSTIHDAICNLNKPVYVLQDQNRKHIVADQGKAIIVQKTEGPAEKGSLPLAGFSPVSSPRQLGDISFCEDHGLRYPYMCGAMANGIASIELVEVAANTGLLASFGAAGLTLPEIENAAKHLTETLGAKPYCFNLIFSPNEKGHEDAVVSLYIKYGIRLVETSAYMKLTLPAVRYRVHGIHRNADGEIETPNRIIAKASRVEIATRWFSPPPEKMLRELVACGDISEEQATLATEIPMAQDLTVEADSGGHTDNRPAITLLPTIIALRDRLQKDFNYTTPLRVGAAGGIATPASAAAAFSMGAAYVVTGTVNQACVESGSSDIVRKMLAEAQQADVTMAPAVDMFEMGVKLQVLKRGTMFAMRGNKLYELYRTYDSIDAIPEKERQSLEKSIFKAPLNDIWQLTRDFFNERDPQQIVKAEQDPKHKMSLIFRWYLGLSSRWANAGEESRQVDYQVWCGPSMGAFNEWSKGSFMAEPANRTIASVAMNLLYGAAMVTRINSLRTHGVKFSDQVTHLAPQEISVIEHNMS